MTTDARATDARHPGADYLEALYELEEEGFPMVQAEIARWMGVSRPSVSEHVKRLVGDGLLTADGRTLAVHRRPDATWRSRLVRRHRLAEHLLIDVIGLPWHQAHQEAEVWERVISAQVEERLVEILGDPGACPHGNPIPGSSHEVDVTVAHRAERRRARLDRHAPAPHRGPRARARRDALPRGLGADAGSRRSRSTASAPTVRCASRSRARVVALGAELADNLWVELRLTGGRPTGTAFDPERP